MRILFLCVCLLTTSILFAEIESITIDWNNIICKEDCANLLQRELLKVKEISDVTVSQQNGVATMSWKASKPFSFPSIDSAIKKVGLHIRTVRVKVRGTIKEQNRKFMITSIGDLTKFNLLGAATDNPSKNRYIPQQSRYNRPLSEDQIKTLGEAIKKDQVVTIEGAILEVYQFPPYDLIIQNLSVSKPSDSNKK